MSIDLQLASTDTVEILTTATAEDPFSGEVVHTDDWANPIVAQTYRGVVLPDTADDAPTSDRPDRTIDALWVHLPHDAQVDTGDRVRITTGPYAGMLWLVDQLPQRWTNPFTAWAPLCSIRIRRVVG